MAAAEARQEAAGGAVRAGRVALVHDWLCGYRGGEAVLDRIARVVSAEHECAGVWTMFDDGRALTPTIDELARHTSVLQRVPGGAGGLRRWLLPLYPLAVESLSRSIAREDSRRGIDLVVSTSSAAVKGVRPPRRGGARQDSAGRVKHLCYCHAPARYLWSRQDEYGAGLRGAGLALMGPWLRAWDRRTAANVTSFAANSVYTQGEIARCYGRESRVIHPPVRTEFFTPGEGGSERGEYWLFAGALEPYKRADLAIAAARLAGRRLVIVGDGSCRGELERMSERGSGSPKVEFEGRVSDERLRELYRTARVLVFPQVEDFGIVAVEAQACGLPVAARGSGGAMDTVADGVTGVLFEEACAAAIARAAGVIESRPVGAWSGACRANAERFGERVFDAAIRGWIEEEGGCTVDVRRWGTGRDARRYPSGIDEGP